MTSVLTKPEAPYLTAADPSSRTELQHWLQHLETGHHRHLQNVSRDSKGISEPPLIQLILYGKSITV